MQAITSEIYLEKIDAASLPDGEVKANMLESIRNIEENLVYINKIVADLQDFARPLTPRKEAIDVEKALKDALAMVSLHENVVVSIKLGEDLPSLNADVTMLKRVLVNLMQNAVQAMPKGGKLSVSADQRAQSLEISVEDTGEGIPEQVRSKLFTPLMTTKSKGQGFGLAVVKRMVEAQGGTIVFESEVGKGTRFVVRFPL